MDKFQPDSKHLQFLYKPYLNNFSPKGGFFFKVQRRSDSESHIFLNHDKSLKKLDLIGNILIYSDTSIKIFNIIYQSNLKGLEVSTEFELVQEFPLFGYIQDIQVIEFNNRAYFICSLDEAKLAILTFLAENQSLKTLELRNIDNKHTENLRKGRMAFKEPFRLKKDHANRAIGYLVYEQVLIILVTKEIANKYRIETKFKRPGISFVNNDLWIDKDATSINLFYEYSIYINLGFFQIHDPIDFEFNSSDPNDIIIYVLHRNISGSKSNNEFSSEVAEIKLRSLLIDTKNRDEVAEEDSLVTKTKYLTVFRQFPFYSKKIVSYSRDVFFVICDHLIIKASPSKYEFLPLSSRREDIENILGMEKFKIFEKSIQKGEDIVNIKNFNNILVERIGTSIIPSGYLITYNDDLLYLTMAPKPDSRFSMSLIKLNKKKIEIDTLKSLTCKVLDADHSKNIEVYLIFMICASKSSLQALTIRDSAEEEKMKMMKIEQENSSRKFDLRELYSRFHFASFMDFSIIPHKIDKVPSTQNRFIVASSTENNSSLIKFKESFWVKETFKFSFNDFDLKTIQAVFTIKEKSKSFFKYLFFSEKSQTSVFSCSKTFELVDNDNKCFIRNAPTLLAKNFNFQEEKEDFEEFVLQITSNHIRLIDVKETMLNLFVSQANNIIQGVKIGQMIAILMKNGEINVFYVYKEDGRIKHLKRENVLLEKQTEKQIFCSCFSKFSTKTINKPLFKKDQDKNNFKKYLVTSSHDGEIYFIEFSIKNETIISEILFHSSAVAEGIPFIRNSLIIKGKDQEILSQRSLTDPNYELGIQKKTKVQKITEIFIEFLNKTLLLILRVDNEEIFVYKSTICFEKLSSSFDERAIDLVFTRVKLNPKFANQKPSFVNDIKDIQSAHSKEQTMPSFSEQILSGAIKFVGDKKVEQIAVYNCKHPFSIFEKEGELFFHQLYLFTEGTFSPEIQAICEFKQQNVEFILCSKQYIHFCTINSEEEKKYDFRTHTPYNIEPILGTTEPKGRAIRKIEVFQQNKKNYLILILSFYKGTNLKFETRIIDYENYEIKHSMEHYDNQRIVCVKPFASQEKNKIALSIAETTPNMSIKGLLMVFDVSNDLRLSKNNNDIVEEDDFFSNIFIIKDYMYLCKGNQINQYYKKGSPIVSLRTQKNLFVSSAIASNMTDIFVGCGDIKSGFSLYKVDEKGDRSVLKELCEENLSQPSLSIEIAFVEDSLIIITSDGSTGISFKLAKDMRPDKEALQKKQEIERTADIYLGSKINKIIKHKTESRFFFCTQDGNIGEVTPLREPELRKVLSNLQNELSENLPFIAGMNPKEFRFHKMSNQEEKNKSKRNFIDGRLLSYYPNLSIPIQKQIADFFGFGREDLLQYIYILFDVPIVVDKKFGFRKSEKEKIIILPHFL